MDESVDEAIAELLSLAMRMPSSRNLAPQRRGVPGAVHSSTSDTRTGQASPVRRPGGQFTPSAERAASRRLMVEQPDIAIHGNATRHASFVVGRRRSVYTISPARGQRSGAGMVTDSDEPSAFSVYSTYHDIPAWQAAALAGAPSGTAGGGRGGAMLGAAARRHSAMPAPEQLSVAFSSDTSSQAPRQTAASASCYGGGGAASAAHGRDVREGRAYAGSGAGGATAETDTDGMSLLSSPRHGAAASTGPCSDAGGGVGGGSGITRSPGHTSLITSNSSGSALGLGVAASARSRGTHPHYTPSAAAGDGGHVTGAAVVPNSPGRIGGRQHSAGAAGVPPPPCPYPNPHQQSYTPQHPQQQQQQQQQWEAREAGEREPPHRGARQSDTATLSRLSGIAGLSGVAGPSGASIGPTRGYSARSSAGPCHGFITPALSSKLSAATLSGSGHPLPGLGSNLYGQGHPLSPSALPLAVPSGQAHRTQAMHSPFRSATAAAVGGSVAGGPYSAYGSLGGPEVSGTGVASGIGVASGSGGTGGFGRVSACSQTSVRPTGHQSPGPASPAVGAIASARAGLITFSSPSPDGSRRGGRAGAVGAVATITSAGQASLPRSSTAGGGGRGTAPPSPLPPAVKASAFSPFAVRGTSMRAFHLSWAALLLAYSSTLAPAAMLPVLQQDMQLSKPVVASAAVASLLAAVLSRVLMGAWVRRYGPRYCQALTLLLTAPALACVALVRGAVGFIAVRLAIGVSLGAFVVTNFWVVLMFEPSVLGAASATATSWGSVGCGLPMLLLPLLYNAMLRPYDGDVGGAWRAVFYFPAGAHLLLGALTLMLGQDTPQGDLLDWEGDAATGVNNLYTRDISGHTAPAGGVGWSAGRAAAAPPLPPLPAPPPAHDPDDDGAAAASSAVPTLRPHSNPSSRGTRQRLTGWWGGRERSSAAAADGSAHGWGLGHGHPTPLPKMHSQPHAQTELERGQAQGPSLAATSRMSPNTQHTGQLMRWRTGSASLRGWRRSSLDVPSAGLRSSVFRGDGADRGGGDRASVGGVTFPGAARAALTAAAGAGEAAAPGRDGIGAAVPAVWEEGADAAAAEVALYPSVSGAAAAAAVGGGNSVGGGGSLFGGSPQSGGSFWAGLMPPSPPMSPPTSPSAAGGAAGSPRSLPRAVAEATETASPRAAAQRPPPPLPPPPSLTSPPSPRRPPEFAIALAEDATEISDASDDRDAYGELQRATAALPRVTPVAPHAAPPPPQAAAAAALAFSAIAAGSFLTMTGELRQYGNQRGPHEPSVYTQWRRNRAQQLSVLGAGWYDLSYLYGIAVRNYRCLLLALNYGLSFGAQVALYNVLTLYLVRQYGMGFIGAGALAAVPGLLNVFSRLSGMYLSGLACRRFGMRGRLWVLWVAQAAGGLWCLLLGLCGEGRRGLAATGVLLILFALSTQIAAGVTFSIVPYVSFRAFTAVLGCTSAGGLLVGAALLAGLFSSERLSYQQGFLWMGAITLLLSPSLAALRFPMWGGMLVGPDRRPGAPREEDYYLAEWSPEEHASGAAAPALQFALHARSERAGSHAAGAKRPLGRV